MRSVICAAAHFAIVMTAVAGLVVGIQWVLEPTADEEPTSVIEPDENDATADGKPQSDDDQVHQLLLLAFEEAELRLQAQTEQDPAKRREMEQKQEQLQAKRLKLATGDK